jgi:tetratricopeptide (TPR) repeat protein
MELDTQKAIEAALSRNWKEAIALNLKILKKDTKNIDALCRLGRAYFETGLKTKAEEIYKKVLRIDKFNSIATKSIELVKASRISKSSSPKNQIQSPPPVFLEEPGITKTITLIRLGDPKAIARLHPGDPVSIVAREHIVAFISLQNVHIGRLPDDLASRLLPLLKAGNKYHAWVKSVTDGVKIFIKEIYRSPKFADVPSFPVTEKLTYAAFTPPELIHTEKPDVSETEQQEDYSASEREPDLEESGNEPPALEDL